MSLYKQLWLSIGFLMILAFCGSFVVSCLSAQAYLEEQLYRKNLDNAASLALSLSAEARDDTMIELFIAAQFDSGHYQFIRLTDPNGDVIAEQKDEEKIVEAPQWLMSAFPIDADPGIAQVSDGWRQVGTLTLGSQTRFAYRQLWSNAKRLFYYFVAVSLGAGLIGSFLLTIITKPLDKAVAHAEAIGERRFITTREPRTREFRSVIRSMNKLSQHVKKMLQEETAKLEKLRSDMQHDQITGLLNREPVLNLLRSFLSQEDDRAHGSLVMIRIDDLFQLNQSEGRMTMDTMLKKFGQTLGEKYREGMQNVAGRLNGSDFLVLLPTDDEAEDAGREFHQRLLRVCRDIGLENVTLHASSTSYQAPESLSTLLRRIDSGIANAAKQNGNACVHIVADAPTTANLPAQDWHSVIADALHDERFTLQRFPVRDDKGELLHWEAPVRLIQKDQRLLTAGQFMPHLSRLGMAAQLDLIVTRLAIEEIHKHNMPIGINLSAALLGDTKMMLALAELIKSQSSLHASELLWLEVPEHGAFQNLTGFKTLCQILKPLRCKLGIEHVGREITQIGALHDLGLDYVKIDRALIHNIHDSTAYQVFLRGLCTIVHSIGLKVIAEGVENENEWLTLISLGVDGGTGTYIT